MRYLSSEPNVDVIGAAVISIVDNLQSDEIQPLLEKHGLTNVQPETWYPVEKWLGVMNDLAQDANTTPNYVAIGMAVAENVVLPPELQSASLADILHMWDNIYQMQHRGGNVGSVQIEKIDENHYRSIHQHIYPDDLTYGLAYGWCRRFLPEGTRFKVSYEEINNRLDQGDNNQTVIIIKW